MIIIIIMIIIIVIIITSRECAAAEIIPCLLISIRRWDISEESWDGKTQWRGKGTVNESGKRDQTWSRENSTQSKIHWQEEG